MNKPRIAVLMGGRSTERDISLMSGQKVVDALREKGYDVKVYDPASELQKIIEDKEQIDVVFPVLHGLLGEDGTVQGFLELIGLPYVGSGVLASALAMDKAKSIEAFAAAGLKVPKGIVIDGNKTDSLERIDKEVGFPCVVKPVSNGSSLGVSIVHDKESLEAALNEAGKLDDEVLAEEYIKGTEITVGVIGNKELRALPVIEIRPPTEFFSREVKYSGETEEIVPARIPEDMAKKAQEYALKAHEAIGCRGMSRTDMILKGDEIFVFEINTIPGMTGESLLPKAAKAAGMEFPELLEYLIDLALEGKDGIKKGSESQGS